MTRRLPTLLALALALLPAADSFAAHSIIPTLAPNALRAGQRAVVKTVFRGSTVEEFEAEIVGVVEGGRTTGNLILARATAERVAKLGIAQGMSGSPVYVDGKLVGAVSTSWSFSREPLFGITPIDEMLEVLDQTDSKDPGSSSGVTGIEPAGASAGANFRGLRWYDEPETASVQLAATEPAPAWPGAPARLALPLACSGLAPAAVEPMARWLAPLGFVVTPGGRAPAGGPPADSLQPGAAVAVDLMHGDLQVSAIGTVTYRDRDRVLLFGHPVFQSGEVRLPLSTAEIVTVVPSSLSSFKLGEPGRTVGVVTQDRRGGVAGRIGPGPRLLPLAVRVAGAARGTQSFRFESIEDRLLAPGLIASAAMNSLLESGGTGANQTLRWTMRLHRDASAPLVLTDVAAGETPPSEFLAGIGAPLRFLFANPYRRLVLDSVVVELEVRPGRSQWTLLSARLLEAAARPGGRVRVDCELERWRGVRETRELDVRVPEEAPDGRYLLWVGGGAELSRYEAGRMPGRYRPTSFEDGWSRLADSRPSDAVYAALYARSPELTSEGRDYPDLPLSALALLSDPQGAGQTRRGDALRLDEGRLPLDGAVRGELQLEVTVDAKAP